MFFIVLQWIFDQNLFNNVPTNALILLHQSGAPPTSPNPFYIRFFLILEMLHNFPTLATTKIFELLRPSLNIWENHGKCFCGIRIPQGQSLWYSNTTGAVLVVLEYHKDCPYHKVCPCGCGIRIPQGPSLWYSNVTRNVPVVFGSSRTLETFGNYRKPSDSFGNAQKPTEIFGNLPKLNENIGNGRRQENIQH